MVTKCTTSLTFSNSTFCPHVVFMCFVWIWEKRVIASLYYINWFVTNECKYIYAQFSSMIVDKHQYGALHETQRQGKSDVFGEKLVPVSGLVLNVLACYGIRASVVRGQWLTAWAMARAFKWPLLITQTSVFTARYEINLWMQSRSMFVFKELNTAWRSEHYKWRFGSSEESDMLERSVVPHFSNGTPILLPLCGTTW